MLGVDPGAFGQARSGAIRGDPGSFPVASHGIRTARPGRLPRAYGMYRPIPTDRYPAYFLDISRLGQPASVKACTLSV